MASHYHTTLIKGAKLSIYPMSSVKAAYAEIKIKTGSAYEETSNWGAAHLLEHMLFQGTHKFPTRSDIENFKEEHGLVDNAYTGAFALGAWVKFPKDSTNAAFELLDETLFHSTIPQGQLQREVNVITQEYKDKWSIPEKRYSAVVDSHLYGKNHILTRDGLGQPEYIQKLTSRNLIDFKSLYFQPQKMVISVAGNVDPIEVTEKIKAILTKEKNSVAPKDLTREDYKFKKPKSYFVQHIENVQSVTVNLVWLTDGRQDLTLQDRLTMGIASYLLGSIRGLLFKRLRQDMGLVYKTGAHRFLHEFTGGFEVWASASPEHVTTVVREIEKIVQEFISTPIPYSNYQRAANYMNIQTLLSYDSVVSIGQQISDNLFNDGRPIAPEEYIKIAKRIREQDVRNLIGKYLNSRIKPYIFLMSAKEIKL